ncbi:hypothetical protein PspLS_00346 [Pyricularia sp. CBS 133598]|nr:hypothetical protein PspLS_00346 [Pyricularia sp. CBS 133598]
MSPSKRSSVKRGAIKREATADHTDDMSPTRPAKKRRRQAPAGSDASGPKLTAPDDHSSEPDLAEEPDSSALADTSGIDLHDATEVANRVSSCLKLPQKPKESLRVSIDHSNSSQHYVTRSVKAFAQILGHDWTYFVTHTTINIGRVPSDHSIKQPPEDSEDHVHIDLGPTKTYSRLTARIRFENSWTLEVKAKSGILLDDVFLGPGSMVDLTSGRVISVGDVEMIFILPLESAPLRIHPTYLERAGLGGSEFALPGGAEGKQEVLEDPLHPTSATNLPRPSSSRVPLPRGQPQPQPQPIAPAPPDYRRPGTPPSVRSRAGGRGPKSSPSKEAGTLLMHPSDVDLAADENQHIKPQYSYAQLITQAIMNTPDGKLNLSGIYNFITQNYSYYRSQSSAGWQNSIRHNLSLNKAFEKIARSTDEPGKGMKWTLVSEAREEMIKNAFKGGRGGHRGSSNPSSPSQLNYVNQGPREMAARDGAPSARKRRVSPSGSPQPRSALRDLQTPIRGSSRRLLPDEPGMGGDGSPLPRIRALGTPKLLPPHMPARALSIPKSQADVSDVATDDDHVPRSPTLTSSYGQDESGLSFVTPAPHRVNLRLAPPSTAQRPSQHMPTSSPAPFWRYADIGSTPMRPGALDFSPSRNRLDPVPQSSSPPNKSPDQSPTRRARPPSRDHIKEEQREESEPVEPVNGKRPGSGQALAPENDEDDEADGGFDLTKGFQSIGSYHAPVGLGFQVLPASGNR